MRKAMHIRYHALPMKVPKTIIIFIIPFCFVALWLTAAIRTIRCTDCKNRTKQNNPVGQDLASFKLGLIETKQQTTTSPSKPLPAGDPGDFQATTLWSKSLSTEPIVLGPRVQSNHTLVTAYFRAKSKYPSSQYDEWMQNMMSLKDPLVIFTQPDLVEMMSKLRSDPSLSTVIVPCTLEDLPISQLRSNLRFEHMGNSISFWEHQLEIDPEKSRHSSYFVFWIWLSKSWLVEQAIQRDYFQSEFYVYTDIGCFRGKKYNHKILVSPDFWSSTVRPDRHTLLWMAHHPPNPPPTYIWTNKLKQKQFFYQSGSQGAGFREAWLEFNQEFAKTLDDFAEAGVFIGEDQCILQATCLRKPELCAYIPFSQVSDNHYFGLRHVLHFPNKEDGKEQYQPWRPPKPSSDFLFHNSSG